MTRIPTGYLLGRALEQKGPGPWWVYILIVETLDGAIKHARSFAAHDHVRAWLHKGGDDYELISDSTHAPSIDGAAHEAEKAKLEARTTELEARSRQLLAGDLTPQEREQHGRDLEQLRRDIQTWALSPKSTADSDET